MSFFTKDVLILFVSLCHTCRETVLIGFLALFQADRDKVLPLTLKDVPNITVDLSLKAFVRFARGKLLAIPPTQNWCLLFPFVGILFSHARKFVSPFDFQSVETRKSTPKSLLNFEDAYFAFFPEMAEITMIWCSYFKLDCRCFWCHH